MNETTKTILKEILDLLVDTRGPIPVTDEEFVKHEQAIRELIEKAPQE